MSDQIRREPTHAFEFQLEDLFDPNDPVAIFVMSISFAWNDLMRDNVRLFETLHDDHTPPGEALYDAGNVSRHLWEITKLLATARDDPRRRSTIRAFRSDRRRGSREDRRAG